MFTQLKRLIGAAIGISLCLATTILARPVLLITPPASSIQIAPGETATDLSFVVQNMSGITLHDMTVPDRQFQTDYYTATVTGTSCIGDLAPSATCTVTINILSLIHQASSAPLRLRVCASKGYVCSYGAMGVRVNPLPITSPIVIIISNLPPSVIVSQSYPVIVSIFNAAPYPLTGISIVKTLPDSVVTSNTCTGTLAAGAFCYISSVFTPTTQGAYHLTGTFLYNEGPPITESTTTVASSMSVIGSVVQDLPADIEKDRTYPVIFQYANYGSANASNITITKTYPAGFTELTDTCHGSTLTPGSSCQITGNFSAPSAGLVTIGVTLTSPDLINPVPLSITSQVTDVVVSGSISPSLPANVTPGQTYPVVFTFTNTNATLPATDITIAKLLPNFTETSDTCTTTLAASASCAISGNFQPVSEGPMALSVVFNYAESSTALTLTTSTAATQATVVGTLVKALPANTEANTPYHVIFQYANHGSATANITNIVKVLPNVINQSGTCTSTLTSGASCAISGDFQNASTGPASLSTTLSYTESPMPVVITTNTTVTDVVVTGTVTIGLPTNTTVGVGYPFTFTFTNTNATLPATQVQVIKALPHTTGVTDTCGSTLAASSSCTIAGTFNASHTGPQTLSAELIYQEGANVLLSTTTTVLGLPYAYITSSANNLVLRCNVAGNGSLSGCVNSGASTLAAPDRIAFSNTHAYIDNMTGIADLSICTITSNQLLTNCYAVNATNVPRGIALNPSNTYLYMSDSLISQITLCTVNPDGSVSACINSGATGQSSPHGLVFNTFGTRIYIADAAINNIIMCPANAGTGALGPCQAFAVGSTTTSVALTQGDTRLYATDHSGGLIRMCDINPANGALSNCQVAAGGFSNPHGIAFNMGETRAYIANLGTNIAVLCNVNPDGTLTGCVNSGATGLSSPRDILLSNVP